jgi:RNA polymerase sigma-70 factor (ECF subfamily)
MTSYPGSSISDRELVARVIARDDDAADIFVLRFSRFVWSVFVRYSGIDETVACDLYQDTFTRLLDDDYRRLRMWRGEGSFVSYLGPIVRHIANDYLRARREFAVGDGGLDDDDDAPVFDPPDDEPGPEELAIVQEQRRMLERAVGRLDERDRLLYRLRHEEDRPYKEIAAETGMTVNNVGVALSRLLKKLEALVKEELPDPGAAPPEPPGGVISPGPGPSGT